MATEEEGQVASIARCCSDIETADFVALDLEFSGLFLEPEKSKRHNTLDEFYEKCHESIPEFLPLQLGVCCARLRGNNTWELRSHEFNLIPQERRLFIADMQSLRFLRGHGFDFNVFFDRAHKYARLPPLDRDPGMVLKRLPPSHATCVMAALRKAKPPLVFHNGLLDLMHLHDKFLGKLPEECQDFGPSWRQHFPLLFDTRLMGQEGRYTVLKCTGLSLEALHKHLLTLPELTMTFERAGPVAPDASAHASSGHDATLTAEVFVMEMELFLRNDSIKASRKRQKKGVMAEEPAEPVAVQAPEPAPVPAVTPPAPASLEPAADPPTTEQPSEGTPLEGAPAQPNPVLAAEPTPAPGPEAAAPVPEVAAPVVAPVPAPELVAPSPVQPKPSPADQDDGGGWTVVSRKRPMEQPTGLLSANLLETHPVCQRFHNRIAVTGAAPGMLDLGSVPGLQAPTGLMAAAAVPVPAEAPSGEAPPASA